MVPRVAWRAATVAWPQLTNTPAPFAPHSCTTQASADPIQPKKPPPSAPPRNAAGQPVVWDVPGGMAGGLAPAAWREQLLMQLLGYAAYHRAQDVTAAASAKPKAKGAAALTQQQQVRGRAQSRGCVRSWHASAPQRHRRAKALARAIWVRCTHAGTRSHTHFCANPSPDDAAHEAVAHAADVLLCGADGGGHPQARHLGHGGGPLRPGGLG